MSQFKNKRVAVLGLSTEGQDSIKFFLSESADITCIDSRTPDQLGPVYLELKDQKVKFKLGPGYLDNLDDYGLIVRSPGVSLRLPELVALSHKGREISSLIKIFFDECKATIIGVTGTKGKGTTSTLIAKILENGHRQVFLGGNVGTPLLSKVRNIDKNSVVVLELSSFQLEDLTRSPHVAVVLRITQEHLANFDKLATSFHLSREAYVEAKKSIVKYQNSNDIAILNADDPTSRSFGELTPAHRVLFSLDGEDVDCYVRNQTVYLKDNGGVVEICKLPQIKLKGMHNLENISAAVLAVRPFKIDISIIRKTIMDFEGLPHRLEFVRSYNGINFYDDSFSTTPETTIAAVKSFSEPEVLILGGSEKGSDFSQMGKIISMRNVKAVNVIGQMTARIVDSLKAGGYKGKIKTGDKNMHDIIRSSLALASSGDVIILTPGCASFDMFANYKQRGDLFKNEVLSL